MPKIALLINSFTDGGAEKVMTVLINRLRLKNINIEIICLEKDFFYSLPDDIKITYLSKFDGSENGIRKLIYIIIFAIRLKKYLKQHHITLVQSHLYRSNYVNVLAKLLGSQHIAQIVNTGRVSKYKEEGLLGRINLFLIKNLYAKANLIILKSKGMQMDMQKLFAFKNSLTVINNPFDLELIDQKSKEHVNDFIFDKNKYYLISIGRLIPLKRNQDLLKAMINLPVKVETIFLGDGQEKENLLALATKFGIDERVHFMGRVANPYKYLANADIFISCSESEGFPNVLVESMACKTPVISSDCESGPREILAPDTDIDFQIKKGVEKAKYGILYPVGDVNSLTRAIQDVLNDKELIDNFKVKGYQRAEDFSVEKIVEQYKKVLKIV